MVDVNLRRAAATELVDESYLVSLQAWMRAHDAALGFDEAASVRRALAVLVGLVDELHAG